MSAPGLLLGLALGGASSASSQDEAATAPEPVQAVLTLVDSPLMVGKPARVKLRLENRSEAAQDVDGGALYGDGLRLTRGDTLWFPSAAPEEAQRPVRLPPGAALEAVIDLAKLEPEALSSHGPLELVWKGERHGEPLFLDVWRDLSAYQVVLETDFGDMRFELYPDLAPRTVKNFLDLVDSHFYDGLLFHRVVKGFMIQGGCPKRDGTGNSGTFIPFERNELKHERGILAMARQASMDSASCQFFVVHERKRFLDGNYCAFGRLVEGYDALDAITEVECKWAIGGPDKVPSRPVEAVTIRKARLIEVGRERGPATDSEGEGGGRDGSRRD